MTDTPAAISLGRDEARALGAFCRRHALWSPVSAARLIGSGSNVGVFATPPWEVMTFAAIPAGQPVDGLDVTVSMQALADALESGEPLDARSLPLVHVPSSQGVTLLNLPPKEGWQVPIPGISGDIAAQVEAASREVRDRTSGLDQRQADTAVRSWWAQPGWSGLTMGVLYAAQQLGMLPKDRSKITAASCGPWKRLSTARGQVFSYGAGQGGALSLAVLDITGPNR